MAILSKQNSAMITSEQILDNFCPLSYASYYVFVFTKHWLYL